MSFVIRCWGWGYPKEDEFNPERRQQRLPCWVGKGSIPGVPSDIRDAARFETEAEALDVMWQQDEWWMKEDDGTPYYWIEEIP